MIKQTENLLEILKMRGVLATLSQRLKEAEEQDLGYEDFLNVIFEDEKIHRENQKVPSLTAASASNE